MTKADIAMLPMGQDELELVGVEGS
jgi:hypothetical protein